MSAGGPTRAVAWRELVGPVHWLGALLVIVGVAGLSLRDPHEAGSFGVCPVLALTGHYCPGCGSLRATYDLMHGHLLEAMGHNALLVLLIPLAVGLWLRRITRFGGAFDPRRAWLWTRLALAGLVLWTVLRNVPAFPFSVLAP